jgi:hypothetical protein
VSLRRLLILAPLLACGPSFHAIHEGNARFEHCYALEENPQSAMREKADCWRDWSEHYTYGQTRDRIQYATARYVALTQAPNIPTDEALMMAAPGEVGRVSTITAPAPTNAFAPPPKVLDPVDGGGVPQNAPSPRPSDTNPVLGMSPDAGGGASPATPLLPQSSCSSSCATTYRDCGGGCESVMSDAGPRDKEKAKICVVCERTYKTCMKGCFK